MSEHNKSQNDQEKPFNVSDQEKCPKKEGEITTSADETSADEFGEYHQVICSIIPPLRDHYRKGQAGRIGFLGGSFEYTGAIYFASISAMKCGADISYVFCSENSAVAIKCYSPELIVFPILDSANFMEQFLNILPRLHVLVIGPGLGRNDNVLCNIGSVISHVKERNMPVVLDADALYFVSKCPEIVRGYTSAILTPNAGEFDRLYSSVFRTDADKSGLNDLEDVRSSVQSLAKTLGHITIVRKGAQDIISNGLHTHVCQELGSKRRCGGQGDILAGIMGTFSYWSHKAFNSGQITSSSSIYDNYTPTLVASLAASMLTRRCSRLAFSKHSRSMTTSNMIQEIKSAFNSLYPVD